jgi:nucleoside-diphosphate-sugar epimerase
MKIVVGGTGFVGTHLLLALTATHNRVLATYRNQDKKARTKALFDYENRSADFDKIDWRYADVTDIPSLELALTGVSTLYNCSGFVSFEPKDYQKLLKINIEGTANLVNCALHLGIETFIHVSSIAALGAMPLPELPITEEAEWNRELKNSDYAISKFGAETEVWRGEQEGLRVLIVNPGVILGIGFGKNSGKSFFNFATKNKYGFPDGTTAFVSVRDVAASILELEKGNHFGQRFILSAGNFSISTVANEIRKAANLSPTKRSLTAGTLWTASVLEYLPSLFGLIPRRLSFSMVRSALSKDQYSNERLIKTVGFEFQSLQKTIQELTLFYLK